MCEIKLQKIVIDVKNTIIELEKRIKQMKEKQIYVPAPFFDREIKAL